MSYGAKEIEAYLARVGVEGPVAVNLATLDRLHRAHVRSIPFENLDVRLGRELSIEPEALFDKLITRRRGGYCFEMNGLLAYVLEAIGFTVQRLRARVIYRNSRLIPPLGHMLLLLPLDGRRWVLDVGFGGPGFTDPMLLPAATASETGTHRIQPATEGIHLLQRREGEGWEDLYSFDTHSYHPVDYEYANYAISHMPHSLFVTTLVCARDRPEGRAVLRDRVLTLYNGDEPEERSLNTRAQLDAALREHFHLELSPEEIEALPGFD